MPNNCVLLDSILKINLQIKFNPVFYFGQITSDLANVEKIL